jgi:hypothetical protein
MEKITRLIPYLNLVAFLSVAYGATTYVSIRFGNGQQFPDNLQFFLILICAPVVVFFISRQYLINPGVTQPGRFFLLWMVMCSLTLDVALRAGKFVSPFAFHEQRNMHWSTFRSSQWNYEHSPVRVEDSIEEIGKHIPRDAKVFTDLHTGYYLKAYLPISLALVKSHHLEGSPHANPGCASVEPDRFKYFLARLKLNNVRYIVSNSDPRNINLQNSCIRNPLIEMLQKHENVTSVSRIASSGYLELFKI